MHSDDQDKEMVPSDSNDDLDDGLISTGNDDNPVIVHSDIDSDSEDTIPTSTSVLAAVLSARMPKRRKTNDFTLPIQPEEPQGKEAKPCQEQ